ncbi:hypothetical protein BU25DRAFT_167962 [Macroventuria anomochaeta]|uniref:Uncharacterized protein n=1 Tax=Macroventuria anomochaeta TaxID=301207 RepID=A0ACB6RSE1_9PLEO|nr:uncharacterized protein BU25DRAFT_167962 [Macroventuria anomochaeta]KAF2623844.1 hypothetical protein BU25DRAFT_167962 [Macroventuria anomochaeta]
MDGIHSFDELQHFLSVPGLDAFAILHVWVGVASMGARGKGLHTPAQLQEIDSLLGRYTETVG